MCEDKNRKIGAKATKKNNRSIKRAKSNYVEMMKTNKEFQSFIDSQKTQAIKTALENARMKWEEENKTKKAEAKKIVKIFINF